MNWIKLSKKESQKQVAAFRICCALALKEKKDVDNGSRPLDWTVSEKQDRSLKDVKYTIEENEKEVLKLIGQRLHIKYDYIFESLEKEGKIEGVNEIDRDKSDWKERIKIDKEANEIDEKINQLEMILYQVFRIMYADRYISYKEKMFFIFICIRLGVLNAETRKALYRRCKRKAILENIKDFNKYVEDKIKKIIKKGSLSKRLYELDDEIKELHDKINERIKETGRNNEFYKKLKEYINEYIKTENPEKDKNGIDEKADAKVAELKNIYKDILGKLSFGTSGNHDRNKIFEALKNYYKSGKLAEGTVFKEFCDSLPKEICNCVSKVKKDDKGEPKKEEEKYATIYDRDWFKYIDINSLGDYRDYINAVVRIEKDVDEEAQKELELYGEINKSYGKDLARYVDFVTGDKMKPSEKADLLFDIFNVILADGKIEDKEDLLFKICAIILNIGIEEYREIKNVLFEFQAKTKGLSFEKRYNNRHFVAKRIKEILKKDMVFLKNKQSRFSLVCSMAFVDGELRTREKVELYDIGLRDYSLDERQITEIIETLDNKEKRSQYFTEMLVNVPRDKKEKLKDLRNCRRIICSDDEITDAERNAFEMVCIFYGVDKEFFSDKKYHNEELSTIPNEYLTEIDDEKRVKITREAYEKIEHIFKNKQVQGSLCGGIQYALDKRYNEHCRNLIRSDRRTTKYAFVIFSISALLLLVFINHHGLGSFKENKYLYKLEHFKELAKDPSYYNKAVSAIADTLKDKSIDSLAKAIAINCVVDIDTALLLQYDTIQKNVKMNIKEDSTKVDWFNVKNRDSVSCQNMVEMTYNHVCKDSSYNCTVDSLNRMLSVFVKNEHIDSLNQSIKDSIKSQVNKLSSDPVVTDYREKKAIGIINQLINGEDNLLLREYNQWLRTSYRNSLSTYENGTNLVAEFFTKCNKWLSSYEALFWLIFITCVCVVVPAFRSFLSRMFLKHNLYTISALLVVLLAVSGELRTSVLLLSTMLSIEWLILMREKEAHNKKGIEQSHSKSHSSLLAILVIMAILADISFGMIELEQLYSLKNVSDKVFSALFLGCICFFVGKFMEMQYMHNIEDKERMQEAIKNISKYLR